VGTAYITRASDLGSAPRSAQRRVDRWAAAGPSTAVGLTPAKGVVMTWVADWPSKAACRSSDPDQLFVQGAAQNRVKTLCISCAVRTECLADALDHRIEFGVWGGMTERERRALLRRRPHVTSWRRLLEAARDDYDRHSGDDVFAPVPAPRVGSRERVTQKV
jgi:WhiB family redox-sensing transcriptional regulator